MLHAFEYDMRVPHQNDTVTLETDRAGCELVRFGAGVANAVADATGIGDDCEVKRGGTQY